MTIKRPTGERTFTKEKWQPRRLAAWRSVTIRRLLDSFDGVGAVKASAAQVVMPVVNCTPRIADVRAVHAAAFLPFVTGLTLLVFVAPLSWWVRHDSREAAAFLGVSIALLLTAALIRRGVFYRRARARRRPRRQSDGHARDPRKRGASRRTRWRSS